MGRINATTDLASAVLEASLSAVGTSPAVEFAGENLNFVISGTFVATIQVEMTFDNGTTWVPIQDASFATRTFTAPANGILRNDEPGVRFRFNMTAWTSGTANCRLSGGGRQA